MAMAMAMTKQQRLKLNWEGMLKWCCLSAYSDGSHLPVRRRWEEGMSSKPLTVEQQEPPSPSPCGFDPDDFDSYPVFYSSCSAYDPPPPPPPAYSRPSDSVSDDPFMKYESMGLLRPWSLGLYYDRLGLFGPSGGIQDDDCPAHSDGTPVRRHSDGIQDNDRPTHSDGTPVPRWWEVKFKKPWRLPPSGTSGILDDDRPAPPPPPPQMSMVGSNSNWEGRLKRNRLGHTFGPYPNYSVQDIVACRVLGIVDYFKVAEDPYDLGIYSLGPEQFEYWLDEIQGYYEFMELAHELHSINRLFPLLHHMLVYPHAACIRAKTAELVTTMVHNNPRSQQLVMELQGLQPLWHNFTLETDATSRTKALGAISALIRNNKPGITAFRETNGYAALRDALSTETTVWFQREALNLIQYLLHENSSDCNTVTMLGLPRIMMHLASSDDAEVRVAILRGLLVLARDEEGTYQKKRDKEGGNSGQLVKNDDKLKQVLQELIKRISAMAPEDLVAAREEIQLVDSLWNACYNEPSSLGEKGLLVLPGKDAPARDVASKLFEPPQRVLAAAEASDRNYVCEKDGNIVTELGLPRIMIHLASSDDAEVREAAMRGLLGLARNEGGNNGQLVKNDDKLKQVLQKRIEGIREEIQLVDSIWKACYNEPSSLKLFEPSLRACAAADRKLPIETLLV